MDYLQYILRTFMVLKKIIRLLVNITNLDIVVFDDFKLSDFINTDSQK